MDSQTWVERAKEQIREYPFRTADGDDDISDEVMTAIARNAFELWRDELETGAVVQIMDTLGDEGEHADLIDEALTAEREALHEKATDALRQR